MDICFSDHLIQYQHSSFTVLLSFLPSICWRKKESQEGGRKKRLKTTTTKIYGVACGIMWKLKPQVKLQRPEVPLGGAWGNKSGKGGATVRGERSKGRKIGRGERDGSSRGKKTICFLLVIQIVSTDPHFTELCWQRGKKIEGNSKSQTTVCTRLDAKRRRGKKIAPE